MALAEWLADLTDRVEDGVQITSTERRRMKGLCEQLNKFVVKDTSALAKLQKPAKAKPKAKRRIKSVDPCAAEEAAKEITAIEVQIARDVLLLKEIADMIAAMALMMCRTGTP